MTYNVHIDNWTKKCMVQCFGTFSCWDMSSEHIVQAVEFNRDARVTDSDMENFADAIATGSNPMRLTDGSTKIVLDNNILIDKIKVEAEDNQAGDANLEDKESAVEDIVEIDEYEDINPVTSKYIQSLFKTISDVIRCEGEVKRSLLVCAFANIDSIDSMLCGDKSVMARLVKWRQHCTSELATRSSIRSRAEVMRNDKNLRLDRRKTMIKDLARLMKMANEFDADQGTFRCFVCRKPMHINDYGVEGLHVVSRADGGACSLANLVPGCLKCNRSSGRVNPIDVRISWPKIASES
ncbi:hypothetical protein PC121_g15660 [Phytophthora cactorum]|nr:hypothetical protein PC121_g15660 [Phytophthora cactorum]